MLKKQLLKEAADMDVSVELDSVFESVELSPEVKDNFSTVFEAAVKTGSAKLAQERIEHITERAEAYLAEATANIEAEVTKRLYEDADKFFAHLASEWMNENKLAVENGIKVQMFESLFAGVKELVVEHNVSLPEDQVDVVAEMEDELAESKAEVAKLFESQSALTAEFKAYRRDVAVNEATRDLSEAQKEKVATLIEGLDYSDTFDSKLAAIVEMTAKSTTAQPETGLNESTLNTSEDDKGLNFMPESVEEVKQSPAHKIPGMDSYLKAARAG